MKTIASSSFIPMGDAILHYKRFGSGKKKIVMFHGFGQDHSVFNDWLPSLSSHYTVYLFDLYFHGESQFPNVIIKRAEWVKHFQLFLDQEDIEKFNLVAYSLGGRFAMALVGEMREKIEALVLLAPDGIYDPFWHKVATSPISGSLFKYLIYNPDKFDIWIKWSEKSGIANRSLLKFVKKELATEENRIRVYKSWTYFKELKYQSSRIRKIFNEFSGKSYLILGNKDNIIQVRKVKKVLGSSSPIRWILLDLKHHELSNHTRLPIHKILLS